MHATALRWSLLAGCLACLLPPLAAAQSVTFGAAKDNTIYSESNSSFGNGEVFLAGKTGTGSIRRGLIQFDVASNVPAGVTLDQVTINFHVDGGAGSGNVNVALHKLLADWGEGSSGSGGAGGGTGNGVPAATRDVTWR